MRGWLATIMLCLTAGSGLAADLPRPVTADDFPLPGATSVLLGRDLFYDPVLSGNRNIACASCHDPGAGSADGLSLGYGEGASGRGLARSGPAGLARLARHTPALYNLGAHEFTALGADGAVFADPATRFGIRLPGGLYLERPLPSPLAAQALMSLIDPDQMAGHKGENPVADAVAAGNVAGLGGAWDLIARRVADTPAYRARFAWLLGTEEPLHATDIARALADFIAFEFRATDAAFDAFLRGDDLALDNDALRGMSLFYGKAGCAACHSGPFQTDHGFHAIGMPQIGPGQGHAGRPLADHGRFAISGAPADRYRFRTPSLRNVTLTAPYGHTGAYPTLDGIIRHHLDALTALAEYTGDAALLPPPVTPADLGAMADFDEVLAIAAAVEIAPVALDDAEIAALIAFLSALTDTGAPGGRLGPPASLPSGLPFDGTRPPS